MGRKATSTGHAGRRVIESIGENLAPAYQLAFRGPIYDYARGLNLQAGYAVKGHFDIDSAQHIRGPLDAIRDPSVRLVSIRAAVQTLKSLIADIVIPYWIEHDPGDCLWLFEDDPKARIYADTRAMPMIRSIPSIHRMLQDVERHDSTKTKIKFAHCSLVVAGLNEGNVQSISYRYVVIDEAWMARANGLIRQAKARTTQYPETKKIILLGQGGWADEDFELEHAATDCRELHFSCPFCQGSQPFDLTRLRPEDHPVPNLRGTYSGLSWDTNATTKPDGRWNFVEVAKTAHLRCYHCDARIEDRPDVRRQLANSYTHVPTNPKAAPGLVGFHWPEEASTRLPLSDQVVGYLKAKQAAEELGYRLPLQEFFQKRRGLSWNEDSLDESRAVVQEPYDVKSDWPEEAHRPMIIDCQKDLATFFYSVFAVSLSGEARELARGRAGSFEELAGVQKEWKVKDQQVFVDCGYEMTKVLRECVARGHVGSVRVGKSLKKVWLCWNGLKGSGTEMWRHTNPRTETKEWRIYSERRFYDVNVGTGGRSPRAPWYEWSNLHCKDLLRARRDGQAGLPKLRFLPDPLDGPDPWSHFAQMRSERRVEKYQGGKKRYYWVLVKETRPNHEWDKGAMLMAFMAIAGIIGATEDGSSAETESAPAASAEMGSG